MKPNKRWALIGMVAIWLAVLVTSLWSPDFVSGSQQEHLKIPAAVNWLWGSLATLALARYARSHAGAPEAAWRTVGLGVVAVWVVVTVASIVGPVFETGSDPTQIPVLALFAPIAGLLITRFLAEFVLEAPSGE